MTTRLAACNCGQLHLTIEGEPSRISMCHCLECQRRTGAVISNQARFRRDQVTFAGRLSWIHRSCHWYLRRPEFPRADHCGVGGITPPMGLLASRHAAQARGEAGMIKNWSSRLDGRFVTSRVRFGSGQCACDSKS